MNLLLLILSLLSCSKAPGISPCSCLTHTITPSRRKSLSSSSNCVEELIPVGNERYWAVRKPQRCLRFCPWVSVLPTAGLARVGDTHPGIAITCTSPPFNPRWLHFPLCSCFPKHRWLAETRPRWLRLSYKEDVGLVGSPAATVHFGTRLQRKIAASACSAASARCLRQGLSACSSHSKGSSQDRWSDSIYFKV